MNIPALPPAILRNRAATARVSTQFRQLAERTLWVGIAPHAITGTQNFTPDLVGEFEHLLGDLKAMDAEAERRPDDARPAYAVIQSGHPLYFSQGGDLRFFLSCIRRGDARSLRDYSMSCLDVLHAWSSDFKSDMTTISLVQGRALGGGFELALSSDYLIAEEQSTFGFPEIMFGLFPCTGAMGLLTARTTPRQAEKMMTNKKVYTARQLLEAGIVDEVCEQGMGEIAVERYIENHAKRRKSRLKVQQSRHRHSAIDYEEGVLIVDDWVETAMRLDADEIRAMEMLILMQDAETVEEPQLKVA